MLQLTKLNKLTDFKLLFSSMHQFHSSTAASMPTSPTTRSSISAFVASCESMLSTPMSNSSSSSSSSDQSNSFEFISSLNFNEMTSEENYDHLGRMAFVDEFSQDSRLLPLPPRLQTPRPCASSYKAQGLVLRWSFSSLSFKKDVDPFMAAAELVKKEDMPWRCSQPHPHHCRTMSMDQSFITSREEWRSYYNQQMVPLKFNILQFIITELEDQMSRGRSMELHQLNFADKVVLHVQTSFVVSGILKCLLSDHHPLQLFSNFNPPLTGIS